MRIGEVLVSLGACTPEAVQAALANQSFFGGRLGTNLLQQGAVTEAQLAAALEKIHGVPCICGDFSADPEAVALLQKEVVEKYGVIPFLAGERRLAVLVRDPTDYRVLDDIAFATGRKIFPFVVPEARLLALMRNLYGIEREGLRGIEVAPSPSRPVATEDTRARSERAEDLMDEEQFLALYGRYT
jgi:Type II secretion system (T2SS), protein E, N-terminal domain